MIMVQGVIHSVNRKLRLKIISSTEAELVAVDDASVYFFRKVIFIECQGYNFDNNILYQDNKSAIMIEVNGKNSTGNRI